MRTIGFRATAKEVFYAVLEGETSKPLLIALDKLKAPVAYDVPQMLAWYREHCQLIFNEFKINACGVRTPEPISRATGTSIAKRYNIEGVIMEASASKGCPCIIGPFATISSLIGEKAKECIGKEDFRCIEDWNKYGAEYKEAILTATAALGSMTK